MAIRFKLNPTNAIQVAVSMYKGRTFLDMRRYYYDADSETWAPAKGLTVPIDKAEEFLRVLFDNRKELVEDIREHAQGEPEAEAPRKRGRRAEADDETPRKRGRRAEAEADDETPRKRGRRAEAEDEAALVTWD